MLPLEQLAFVRRLFFGELRKIFLIDKYMNDRKNSRFLIGFFSENTGQPPIRSFLLVTQTS
jgi:hypothetical protein